MEETGIIDAIILCKKFQQAGEICKYHQWARQKQVTMNYPETAFNGGW